MFPGTHLESFAQPHTVGQKAASARIATLRLLDGPNGLLKHKLDAFHLMMFQFLGNLGINLYTPFLPLSTTVDVNRALGLFQSGRGMSREEV